MSKLPLSVLDFATIYKGEDAATSFKRSVQLAQQAEARGYLRMWYAEHHNMPTISSSSPAVLISHVGAHTKHIRLGAGGIMLPNHSPYVIAEQFGTLAHLYPGRIDLGLGRAPGTDQMTLGRALRRSPHAAASFPDDVVELEHYLAQDDSLIDGVQAVPGNGTFVPLYILGSSMFGAELAAKLGLPYAFASHFAPQMLTQAVSYYRENFQPSAAHPEPYVIAAVNVTGAHTQQEAHDRFAEVGREWVRRMASRGQDLTEEQLDQVMASAAGAQLLDMMRYTAVGTGTEIKEYLDKFAAHAQADELMISFRTPTFDQTLETMDILADAWDLETTDQ